MDEKTQRILTYTLAIIGVLIVAALVFALIYYLFIKDDTTTKEGCACPSFTLTGSQGSLPTTTMNTPTQDLASCQELCISNNCDWLRYDMDSKTCGIQKAASNVGQSYVKTADCPFIQVGNSADVTENNLSTVASTTMSNCVDECNKNENCAMAYWDGTGSCKLSGSTTSGYSAWVNTGKMC